ncbi:MAG: hypothetical protein LBD25_01745 [Coriobacteriales bacterium]|nr:hypothetical protein [Coriobacteriales bacterium]
MLPSQPEFFVDHCMGTQSFPDYLRKKGYRAHTVLEHFGRPDASDSEWIEVAVNNNWIAITKDAAIVMTPGIAGGHDYCPIRARLPACG